MNEWVEPCWELVGRNWYGWDRRVGTPRLYLTEPEPVVKTLKFK